MSSIRDIIDENLKNNDPGSSDTAEESENTGHSEETDEKPAAPVKADIPDKGGEDKTKNLFMVLACAFAAVPVLNILAPVFWGLQKRIPEMVTSIIADIFVDLTLGIMYWRLKNMDFVQIFMLFEKLAK